jgi:hypothetical protein
MKIMYHDSSLEHGYWSPSCALALASKTRFVTLWTRVSSASTRRVFRISISPFVVKWFTHLDESCYLFNFDCQVVLALVFAPGRLWTTFLGLAEPEKNNSLTYICQRRYYTGIHSFLFWFTLYSIILLTLTPDLQGVSVTASLIWQTLEYLVLPQLLDTLMTSALMGATWNSGQIHQKLLLFSKITRVPKNTAHVIRLAPQHNVCFLPSWVRY